jgi:hypothetical protein
MDFILPPPKKKAIPESILLPLSVHIHPSVRLFELISPEPLRLDIDVVDNKL